MDIYDKLGQHLQTPGVEANAIFQGAIESFREDDPLMAAHAERLIDERCGELNTARVELFREMLDEISAASALEFLESELGKNFWRAYMLTQAKMHDFGMEWSAKIVNEAQDLAASERVREIFPSTSVSQ